MCYYNAGREEDFNVRFNARPRNCECVISYQNITLEI